MKIVIIGGDAAGMSAAMEITREMNDAQIVILEKGTIYSYGQCGLPYVIDGRVTSTDDLIARPVESFQQKYGMDTRVLHEVTAIDTAQQTVSGINHATGEPFEESYDRLLIATGASPTKLDVEGNHLAGIHAVKTIPQMEALMHDLQHVKRAVVIGGGYIGLEVAEALALRGIGVTIVQRSKQLMPALHATFAQQLVVEANKHQVNVQLEETLEAFEGAERVTAVRTNKGRYEADVVIVAAGVRPNTAFLPESFEKLGNGALIVNAYQQTSVKNVYAAGDCASHFHRLTLKPDYLALGTTANKQGRVAGRVIAGMEAQFNGIVGTSILKFFELQIGMTGLTLTQAKAHSFDAIEYDWEANAVASYYEIPPKLQLKMVVEQQTNRLLGLQMIGTTGVDKRIDVFATALHHQMTLPELIDLDLSYAPPFNGVWDALLQVAKRFT